MNDPGSRDSRRPKRSKATEDVHARLRDADAAYEADQVAPVVPLSDHEPADRYPEQHMPIAGVDAFVDTTASEDDEERSLARADYERFCEVREDVVLNYTYNTARAYWGDLDDIFWWCVHRGFDMFELTDEQMRDYDALLRRRKYSENTIRRRGVVLRHFRAALARRARSDDE